MGDSDSEFDDDSIDWDDPSALAILSKAESAPAAPPPPKQAPPPIQPIAKRSQQPQTILRKPIVQSNGNGSSLAHGGGGPPNKKQKLDTPPKQQHQQYSKAGRSNPVVHPNPFHHQQVKQAEVDDEEDLPEIRIQGDGNRYAAVAASTAKEKEKAKGQEVMNFAALKEWGGQTPKEKEIEREREKEKEELKKLREERNKLQSDLQKTATQVASLTTELHGRSGEISIVRRRLARSEEVHLLALEEEKKLKKDLENKLAQKETQHKREIETLRTENAFKRLENETSRRTSMHHTPSSAKRPAAPSSSSVREAREREGSMGPPRLPRNKVAVESPTRKRVSQSVPPPSLIAKPSFPGFKNSFDSPSTSTSITANSSVTAVKNLGKAVGVGLGLFTPEKPVGKGKGKERMEDLREENEEMQMEDVEEEDDLSEVGAWEETEGDWRGEIMSAIFNHTTYQDPSSSTSASPISVLHQPLPTPSSTANASNRPPSASTSSSYLPSATSSRTQTLRAQPIPASPSSSHPIPVPTFHLLTNLRLESTTIPLPLQASYEQTCRELFTVLGKEDSPSSELLIGNKLDTLISVLEKSGVVGPLCAAIRLCALLGTVSRGFARWWLGEGRVDTDSEKGEGKSSELVEVLGIIVAKYCRPGLAPSSSSATNEKKQREKERRLKRQLFKMGGTAAVQGGGQENKQRVNLDSAMREDLLEAVLEVLEMLAGRMEDGDDDVFARFVEQEDVVATLLDPGQSAVLLIGTVRFLSLLACRASLFRSLINIKFYDAQDVRATPVPIFDRMGTLLLQKQFSGTPIQLFALDQCVITLVTILSMKNTDAIRFITTSISFIPELLAKLFDDVRTVWEYDGMDVSNSVLSMLKLVVERLSSTVHLFYYLACAFSSAFNMGEFFNHSAFVGLQDRFLVAFGTLSFASLPDWTVGLEEGPKLTELGYFASEVIDDLSPTEVEEVESCFATGPVKALVEEGDGEEDERQLREVDFEEGTYLREASQQY